MHGSRQRGGGPSDSLWTEPPRDFVIVPRDTFLEYRDALHQGLYIHPLPIVRWFLWSRLRSLMAFAPGGAARVLDYGCGDGALLPTLARRYRYVVGLDLDTRAAARVTAHYRLGNVRLVEADGTALPFPDGHFDLVLATEVLEHVHRLDGGLGEIHRVLSGRGLLVVSAPTENSLYGLGRWGSGFVRPEDHYNNAASVSRAAARLFDVEAQRYFPVNAKPLGVFLLMRARKRDGSPR
jgi:SAM-dependent methyltransferase